MESIFLTLRHEYKNKPFKYHINCDKDLEIYSYPGAMSQIFTNLIINALKHGFKGEETLIVNIDVEEKENDIIIKFKDNGRGIPPEQVRHIFEPFFTTKRNEGGSGLGLNIVYNIVTITLEGSITCESELNNGLLFTFKIPKSTQKG